MVFVGPAKGALEGAWRGTRVGFLAPIAVGGVIGGPVFLAAGIALAPVTAVAAGVFGATEAEPASKVKEKEAVIRAAMSELKIQEAFRDCASAALREQAPHIVVTSPGGSASMILEVTLEKFGLDGDTWDINPPLRLVMTERTRMIRAADSSELYTHRLTWRGQLRPLDEWVARDGTLVKEEARGACRGLAESLVDEAFLLYLTTDER
jgi:hypothetical protein